MKTHEFDLEALEGLGETAAILVINSDGFEPRIVYRDGTYFAVAYDGQFNRVNLEIEDGIVVKAVFG